MSRLPLAILAVSFCAALAAADDSFNTGVDVGQMRKAASQQANLQGRPMAPKQVARYGTGPFAAEAIKSSVDWIKQTPDIALFINDNGCVKQGGKYVPARMSCPAARPGQPVPACFDLSKAVDAAAQQTEIVFVDKKDMASITGMSASVSNMGGVSPVAFGITKELKQRFRTDRGLIIGDPNKNTIALKGAPAGPGDHAPQDGPFSLTLAHEFLHIVLRQVHNAALGGDDRKTDSDPAIANLHHRLTDYLNWRPGNWQQSDKPWQRPDQAPACPSAAAAGQGAQAPRG